MPIRLVIQGKGDNVYKVTVKASGGSQDVEVSRDGRGRGRAA